MIVKGPAHTLCHINIGTGKSIGGEEASVHVDAMLEGRRDPVS